MRELTACATRSLATFGITFATMLAPSTLCAQVTADAPPTNKQQRAAERLSLARLLQAPRSLLPDVPRLAWIEGTDAFSVVTKEGDGSDAVARVEIGGNVEKLFDAEDLRAAFEGVPAFDRESLPTEGRVPGFSWLDADTIRLERADGIYHWNLNQPAPRRVLAWADSAPGATRSIAMGDAKVVTVVDHDLVVELRDGGNARITWDGKDGDIVYGGAAHRAEFGIRSGLWWSPDARFLAFSREDMREIAIYPYTDYSTLPATRQHGRYPMAGQTHSKVRIGVYDTKRANTVYLEHDPDADIYWTNVTFTPDGREVWVALVDRGQTECTLARFDSTTGERIADVLQESDPEWIEPEWGPIFLPSQPDRFLWASPRSGFRNLYEYGIDGTLHRPLTRAEFDLRSFGGFNSDDTACYVTGSGKDKPLEMHLWRVELASGEMSRMTPSRGRHDCLVSSRDHLLSTMRSVEDAAVIFLRPNGEAAREFLRLPDPLADLGVRCELLQVETSDGSTTLHGYLLHPPEFDASLRYPLIHYVYGGPHSQLVTDRPYGGASLWLRYMASQGFLVSCVDNRGTDNRGIEFAQCIHRRLGELEVDDQLTFLDAVVAKGYVDPQRIGVHGWSYGGYMTLQLMLKAPTRFAAGVSGAPVTDWARYETGYGERYMDTPQENPKGFATSSVLPLAGELRGRLLLISPSDDKTVMASHSVAFLQACVDAGSLIDHMVYPMQKHGLRGKHRTHFYRLMTRYFREHLGMPGDEETKAAAPGANGAR